MSKKDFRLVKKSDRTDNKGELFTRGYYDLVALNPNFVRKIDAIIVAGKNYKRFCNERDKINVPPLSWICEIVFGSDI